MFKEGSFVKIKDGIELETKEKTKNWAGKILEIYEKEKTCLIRLDSITLNSLSDLYLRDCIENGSEPYEYVFEIKDIELSDIRDSEEEFEDAVEEIVIRMSALDEDPDYDERIHERWLKEFEASDYFEQLNEYQRENAGFIIETFLDYMYNYEYVTPNEWKPENIREVCLNVIPRKISSEQELFENYGTVLHAFLKFLDSKNYIPSSENLQSCVLAIKNEIPKVAKDPRNWGMAKSMMMQAKGSGVDFTNQEELNKFMLTYNRNLIEKEQPRRNVPRPVRNNPYKDIGRNQRITVKYGDGRIIENIKFKKVQQDLEDGQCELIKK